MALQGPAVIDQIAEGAGGFVPTWVAFLVVMCVISLLGLVLGRRYQQLERQRGQGLSERLEAEQLAETIVMPIVIARLDARDERTPPLQVDLDGEDDNPSPPIE